MVERYGSLFVLLYVNNNNLHDILAATKMLNSNRLYWAYCLYWKWSDKEM